MKKGNLKIKLFTVTAALSLLISAPLNPKQSHDIFAIEPNSRNITSYYEKHLISKHQRINGPCWAFASTATLETFLCKKGLLKESLSEKHLLSWANQPQNLPGWHVPITHGGNSCISKGYLMSGAGPVASRTCPYTTYNNTYTPQMAACRPLYWIKGIKDTTPSVDSIKADVSQYGAVAITYPATKTLNHAVAVIGWDDNSKEWIVKDSSSQPSNYKRLPFRTKILDCYCITDAETFQANQIIHQNDYYGVTAHIFSENCLKVANVFDFQDNEILDSVTICSKSPNSNITFYLAPTDSEGRPCGFPFTWTYIYSGSIPYSGYSTFKLNRRIKMEKGKYAVIARIDRTEQSSKPSICAQLDTAPLLKTCANNRSFLYDGLHFIECKKDNQSAAFSIKAITLAT